MDRKLNRILPPLSLTELRTLYSDLSQLTEKSLAEIPGISPSASEHKKNLPNPNQRVEKITNESEAPRPPQFMTAPRQSRSLATARRPPSSHSPLRPAKTSLSGTALPGAPLAEAVVAAARNRELARAAGPHSGAIKAGPKIIRNRLESPQPPRTDDFSRVLPPEVAAAPKLKPLAAGPSPEAASLYSTDLIKRPLN